MESVARLNEFVRDLCPETPVVIDASGVEFMDSSGLHVLLKLAALSDGHAGVIIRNPSPFVRRLLQMALPDGMDGMEVEYAGSGPGAQHRLSGLLNITAELHRMVRREHRRSRLLLDQGRRRRANQPVLIAA
jgi:hypothetical protein